MVIQLSKNAIDDLKKTLEKEGLLNLSESELQEIGFVILKIVSTDLKIKVKNNS